MASVLWCVELRLVFERNEPLTSTGDPGVEPLPFTVCCWARRRAEISRDNLLTCASDSASRAFSSSIFSSRSCGDNYGECTRLWRHQLRLTFSNLRDRILMMRSSSASYALIRDSLLLEFVDDNRLNGGESDITTARGWSQ